MLYERSERTSRAGPTGGHRPVDVWDRFIQRITAGQLRGKDVPPFHPA